MERKEFQDVEPQDYQPSFLNQRFSRREFLFLSSLVALKVLARTSSEDTNLGWLLDTVESRPTPQWITDLSNYDISLPDISSSPHIYGLAINTPFLYRAPRQKQEEVIEHFYRKDTFAGDRVLMVKRARIIVDDSLQPGIRGSDNSLYGYDDSVLHKIAEYAYFLEERGIDIEVDAFDFFTMGNNEFQPTFVYGSSKASSIYNKSKDKAGYRDFFLDAEINGRYLDRVNHIFDTLIRRYGVKNISVASPGNEPYPKFVGDDIVESRDILTRWHQKAIDVIHTASPSTAVVASVVQPWDINVKYLNGLAATSVHGHIVNIELEKLRQYRQKVFIQETGFPERISLFLSQSTISLDVPSRIKDFLCMKYLESLVDALVDVNPGDAENRPSITPYITGIAGWKADVYNDWYHFFPDTFPQTFSLLYYLDTWLFQRIKEKIR